MGALKKKKRKKRERKKDLGDSFRLAREGLFFVI